MNTERMTVHKALIELKTLDSRISKAIAEMPFVFANKHANTKVNGIPISEYCEQIKSSYKSAEDLITRRNALKRAVVLSNATTKVVIGGNEYTVAEAIEMKNHGMEFPRELLTKMSSDYQRAQRNASLNNGDALEDRADDYIKSMFGNTDMKNATEDAKKARAEFIASQTVELIDPISVKEKMGKLEEYINSFMVDVDAALSVSNATTEVEFSY